MSKRYKGGFISASWTPLAEHGDNNYLWYCGGTDSETYGRSGLSSMELLYLYDINKRVITIIIL